MGKDLVIAWISSTHTLAYFTRSVAKALLDDRVRSRVAGINPMMSGPLIAQARTKVVEQFLETDAEWLLQIDTDMTFTPDDVLELLRSADPVTRPIVGGMYRQVGWTPTPATSPPEAGWLAPRGQEGNRWVSDDARGLVDVDVIGAGFLLVHRDVFTKLAQTHGPPLPWFAEEIVDGFAVGEDYTFCHRAKSAGFPITLNADVRLGHVKTIAFGI